MIHPMFAGKELDEEWQEAINNMANLINTLIKKEMRKDAAEKNKNEKEPDIKASCTWGDGSDVMVTLNNKNFILYENPVDRHHFIHGTVKKGSFDLTADEALSLGLQLIESARHAKNLDLALEQQILKDENRDKECNCNSGYVSFENYEMHCMICKGKLGIRRKDD